MSEQEQCPASLCLVSEVWLLWGHASSRIVPRHQDFWFEMNPYMFYSNDSAGNPTIANIDEFGNRFFTLGADPANPDGSDPDTTLSCVDTLKSRLSRPGDVGKPARDLKPASYPSTIEDTLILKLIQLDAAFEMRNDVGYACFPGEDQLYNSNSYTAGLLRAAQIGSPSFPLIQQNVFNCTLASTITIDGQHMTCDLYPGWTKPLPLEKFK